MSTSNGLPLGITAAAVVTASVFIIREILDRRNRRNVAKRLLMYHIDFLIENLQRQNDKIEHLDLSKLESYIDIYLSEIMIENSFKEYQRIYLRWRRDYYSPENCSDGEVKEGIKILSEARITVDSVRVGFFCFHV